MDMRMYVCYLFNKYSVVEYTSTAQIKLHASGYMQNFKISMYAYVFLHVL